MTDEEALAVVLMGLRIGSLEAFELEGQNGRIYVRDLATGQEYEAVGIAADAIGALLLEPGWRVTWCPDRMEN